MKLRARYWLRAGVRTVVVAMGIGIVGYGTYALVAWWRYGQPAPGTREDVDALLDRFMPAYEVVERHRIEVDAPADVTLEAAKRMDLFGAWPVRTIFRARELVMGGHAAPRLAPANLLGEMESIGWGILTERPDREVVVGAVTRPWEADVVFRPLPPDDFAAFAEPDYVKIVWTLRADPVGPMSSVFRTETRVMTTDEEARGKFRAYWALTSPGIWLVRRLSLGPLKADAERQSSGAASDPSHKGR